MRTYLLKRLLLVPPTMLGITLISFMIIQLAPGDPANMKVNPGVGGEQQGDKSVSKDVYEKTLKQFDLDKPKLMQYIRWVGRLCAIDVQVEGAKDLYKAEVSKFLLERFDAQNKDEIAKQETRIKAQVEVDWTKRKATLEREKAAAEAAAGDGKTPKKTRKKKEHLNSEADMPKEVERRLLQWKEGQAAKQRHRYTKELSDLRQGYLDRYETTFAPGAGGKVKAFFYNAWYGKGFDGHFEYKAVDLNKTEEGWPYFLDFGTSFDDEQEVLAKLNDKLWVSMELSLLSIFLAYIVAIPLGIHSSVSQGTLLDQGITTTLFVLYSLPSFWVAIMALLLVSEGGTTGIHLFPVSGVPALTGDLAPGESFLGRIWDHIHHLMLPVACLTYASFAYISRQMRAGMLDVIRSDFIRTARAKGLSESVVIFKHALRNSLIPILTIVAVILPALVGGSVIIETIFNIDGIGKLSFDAILKRDYPILMAIFTLSAFLTLIGILVSDLLYAVVDPRISFGGE